MTSYVDDFLLVSRSVAKSLAAVIELVYELTACGLAVNADKCCLVGSTSAVFLGIIIDSARRVFRLPDKRVARIDAQLHDMHAKTRRTKKIPAREVAQVIGLLWAASPCCPRAIHVMARGMIAVLAAALRKQVWAAFRSGRGPRPTHKAVSLKVLTSRFWAGCVLWSPAAEADLLFWLRLNFKRLMSPISADTFEAIADGAYIDPSSLAARGIHFFATDASATACGGGRVSRSDGRFQMHEAHPFFSELPAPLRLKSSGLREMTAILWLLQSLPHPAPIRIVVFTDSEVARDAIRRGSKVAEIQAVSRAIFLWTVANRSIICICWVSRNEPILVAADSRSRWSDTHGDATPAAVFAFASALAQRLWGRPLSIDRMASHMNVMPPPGMGKKLPFNSKWAQPGTHGVDMFVQPPKSWRDHINFIHPARPAVGRVITFLTATRSRTVVVTPEAGVPSSWWSTWAMPGGPGVVESHLVNGFRVTAVDHRPWSTRSNRV